METLKPESNIKKKAAPKYSPEVRERAVGMVLEHQRALRFVMESDRVDRGEVRLLGRNVAQLGAAGRA